MRYVLLCLAIVASSVVRPAACETDGQLMVRATAVSVQITAKPERRRLIQLPDLDFALRVDAHCNTGKRIESVSISIADTHKTYDGTQFEQQRGLETSISLPQKQIGPLSIEQFCIANNNVPITDKVMRVPDALTAQVSLRCADDTGQSIIYKTLPLEISLECSADDAEQPGADDNQDSSTSTTRF